MFRKEAIWVLEDNSMMIKLYQDIFECRYILNFFKKICDLEKALFAVEDRPNSNEEKPKLLLSDLRLPDGNFFDVISGSIKFRSTLLNYPILIVSVVDDADILRFCLNGKAVDYLCKPFCSNELVIKVEKILRESCLKNIFDRKTIDELTQKEGEIFNLFYNKKGISVTRDDILLNVWGGISVQPKTVDVHLFNLRKKLIHTYWEIISLGPNKWVLQDRVQSDVNPF